MCTVSRNGSQYKRNDWLSICVMFSETEFNIWEMIGYLWVYCVQKQFTIYEKWLVIYVCTVSRNGSQYWRNDWLSIRVMFSETEFNIWEKIGYLCVYVVKKQLTIWWWLVIYVCNVFRNSSQYTRMMMIGYLCV